MSIFCNNAYIRCPVCKNENQRKLKMEIRRHYGNLKIKGSGSGEHEVLTLVGNEEHEEIPMVRCCACDHSDEYWEFIEKEGGRNE